MKKPDKKLHLIAADNSGNEARLKINCLIDKTVPTLDNAENYSFQEDGKPHLCHGLL